MYLTKPCTFTHSFFVPKSGKKKLKTLIVKSRLLRLCVSTSISQLTKGKLPPLCLVPEKGQEITKPSFEFYISPKKKKSYGIYVS